MSLFVKSLKNKILKWSNRSFITRMIEVNRLASMPRFQQGETKLLGRKILFSDAASFLESYHEIFEQKLYKFKSNSPRPVIIDCGANLGLSIIFFKTLYPEAKIIAFEPDPSLFKLLETNIATFNFRDVELHQKAVMDVEGKVAFLQQGGSSGKVLDLGEAESRNYAVEVEAVGLKSYMTAAIDFLKIDIEGAESEVIRSIETHLMNVKTLFVEYHSFAGKKQTLHELLSRLRNAEFRYYIYPAITKPLPFEGIDSVEGMDMQLNIYAVRQ